MNKRKFIAALKACRAVKLGKFRLSSGKTSNYYIDIKRAITQPELLKEIARRITPYIKGYDRIAGVELGAVPIAAAVSLKTGVPFIIVRKKQKKHGTKQPYDGELNKGDRVVFVEDVVTTGRTLRIAIERLRSGGAKVDIAIAVVDRNEGGTKILTGINVRLVSLLKVNDLEIGLK